MLIKIRSLVLQKELQELQKRLVVLGCQLRKAEVGKRTYEVATDKLVHFAEVRTLVFFYVHSFNNKRKVSFGSIGQWLRRLILD